MSKKNTWCDETTLRVLSSYERGILQGAKRSDADEIIEGMKTQTLLNNMIQTKITERLPDGTEVTATAEELMVASAIADTIKRGSMEKLMTFMKVKGEMKANEVAVSVSNVDKDLEERALE